MRILFAILLIINFQLTIFSANVNPGDWVWLKGGYGFEGDVIKFKKCVLFMDVEGERLIIPVDSIDYLEFANPKDNVAVDLLSSELDNCTKGKFDASLHGRGFGNGCLGFFFGVFGVIGTALGKAKPIRGMRASDSKNQDLFNDPNYMKCYARRQRGRAVGSAIIGWAIFIVFYLSLTSQS